MSKKKKKVKSRKKAVMQKKVEHTIPLTAAEAKTKELRARFGNELYDRATLSKNKIGMTDEQVATYTDANTLKMACDNIRPVTTPQPQTFRKRKPPTMRKKGVPAQVEIESVITVARAVHVQRSSYDESEMRGKLMKLRIKYESVQSVVFDRDTIPDCNGRLTTRITVNYLK